MPRRRFLGLRRAALLAAAVAATALPARAMPQAQGNALRGLDLAEQMCAACHALTPNSVSPNPAAPNFNTLTLAYPAEHLAEGFAEGILVGTDAHIGMPQFELAPEQIDDLIAYLETVLPPPDIPAQHGASDYMDGVQAGETGAAGVP